MKYLITTIAAVVLVGTAFADPIHDAARKGDLAGVQVELDKGADLNTKVGLGWTPLHFAVVGGYKTIAELLITKGADVNAKSELNEPPTELDWSTPLHLAVNGGRKEIVELLIAKGADVNANRIIDSETPLDIATRRNKTEIATILRKHGGKTGVESLIYTAIAKGNIKAVKQHLAAGTDVNTKDKKEWTPLFESHHPLKYS